MHDLRELGLSMRALAVALLTGAMIATAAAQTPAPPPANPPAPATEAPAAKEGPKEAPKEAAKDAPKEASKEAPANPAAPVPSAPPAVQATDPFGEEITLTARTVVILKNTANWDSAFETLVDSFKKIYAALDKAGAKAEGAPLVVYTSTDDTGFAFQIEIPVAEAPKNLPKDIAAGKSPEGKMLKFVHRGSYDNMDNTYEAITNHLDEKKLEAQDLFIEEYTTDPIKTPEDKLVINVFVPLK